jgi:prolyl oligopeptidase
MLRRALLGLAPVALLALLIRALGAATLASAAAPPASDGLPPLPKAPKMPITDVYWGQSVQDDYQYMEKPADAAVGQWAREENAYTRAWLDRLPARHAILDRIVALNQGDSPDYYNMKYRGGTYFVLKEQPPKQQPFLVALTSVSDLASERVVVNPNAIDPTGQTSMDFYSPSLDGKLVAISLSKDGTEDGSLHVYETLTGRKLEDVIPGVNGGTAGGSAAWDADGSGIYYTRYPRPGERPEEDLPFYQQIYFHKLGTPVSADSYVLGREFPKIAEIELATSPDGRYVMADVSNGDGGEHAYWLRAPDGTWTRFADFKDGVIDAQFGMEPAIYVLSRDGAPNKKVLRLSLESPDLKRAQVVVPETGNAIDYFTPTASRVWVTERIGGPTQMRVYGLNGREIGVVPMPEIAMVGQAIRTTGDEILVRSQSYTHPPAYYRCGPTGDELVPTALKQTSPVDFSAYEVRREYATGNDGTKIPVNIILRRGTSLDGGSPLLLHGYGSYGISQTPNFDPALMAWLEQGGVYVDASVRGGGEYGDAWHRQARLGTKKVSMDDFAACARYLVERGYTKKERLAIEGGSAGGLLVYGTIVHYPDAMQAAVAHVGYGDVLRTELEPNGEFNTTEFGTVKDSTQFRGMYSYSPYHHVKDGRTYPSVLSLTGVNDPRVASWGTFKMVARLQASGSPNPVLMRVAYDAGHGVGASRSQRDHRAADVLLFLFDRLGVKYVPVPSPAPATSASPNP